MQRSKITLVSLVFIVAALLITGIGCAKKVTPPPPEPVKEEPPPPPPKPEIPAPTISLSASPAAIERGQSATLSWNTSNATSVVINNGVGSVAPSGRRAVNPSASTTYLATATGPGGKASAEARVTVTEPPKPKPKPISDSEFFKSNIQDAFFDFDMYNIRDDARAALMANARALKERPSILVTIEGHCDERGSSKYNLALGDRRANAAKEFLVNQGIDASRIETVSYGEERNFCKEKTEECYQSNRRAHFVMR